MSAAKRIVHNFGAYLARENREAEAGVWGRLYRRLYPDLERIAIAPVNSPEQKAGIDRTLFLRGGTVVKVQEKTRYRPHADMLIEFLHVRRDGREWPGWIEKTRADVLTCYWKPQGVARAWQMDALRLAWRERGRTWVSRFTVKRADNGAYSTLSVCVPLKSLPPCREIWTR